MNKKEQMEKIGERLEHLEESPLYTFRRENNYQPVIGEGDLDAQIIFIGEAPGKNEAETGRPFCGRAGNILDDLLNQAKLNRSEVYITNIVKDRPPKNRRPTKEEVQIYTPFLLQQLKIIQPKIVVTLGSTSTNFAFEQFKINQKFNSFGEVVGEVFHIKYNDHSALLYPLYHPAYAIYQRTNLPKMCKEFSRIPGLLEREEPPN